MAVGLGINDKLYRNTGNFGTPTWVELDGVSDVKVNSSWDTADGSTRRGRVKMMEATQQNLTLDAKLLVDGGTDYVALAAAYWARSTIDVMCLDGGNTTNGSEGVRFESLITKFDEDQGLGSINFRDVTFTPRVPSVSTNVPKSVLVTAGNAVFTTI